MEIQQVKLSLHHINQTNKMKTTLTPTPKYYYPNLVGKHRIGNGTPEGVEALRKSLERSAKKC